MEAINSCLNQDYKNIEILICDDGSTDQTENIAKEYQKTYPNMVRYFKLEHSESPAIARNVGLKNVKGEFISFLDSDDLMCKDKLTRQTLLLTQNPSIDILCGNAIKFNDDGLVPVITQDAASGKVLMLAWMNRESLSLTEAKGESVYWSRSRDRLWHKGEESGHIQKVVELRFDCDEDVILLKVEQQGGIACHTGRASCFYRQLQNGEWIDVEPVIKDPKEIYK